MVIGIAERQAGQVGRKYVRPPFSEAHVTICEGDPRQGKTCTAVARVRDAYDKDSVHVYCEEVLKVKCEVKSYNRHTRVAKIRYNGGLKLLRVPPNYKMHSPMKIFSNTPLYGIPYVFLPTFEHMMEWLKQGIIADGWLIVDEAQVGMNARACMTELGKELAKLYHQFGKMQLDVVIVVPMARQIDYLLRTVPTERIHCTYDARTKKITLLIRKRGVQGEKRVGYYAPEYWPNFDTSWTVAQ